MAQHTENRSIDDAMELLKENGFDGLAEAVSVLLNAAMLAERSENLGPGPYGGALAPVPVRSEAPWAARYRTDRQRCSKRSSGRLQGRVQPCPVGGGSSATGVYRDQLPGQPPAPVAHDQPGGAPQGGDAKTDTHGRAVPERGLLPAPSDRRCHGDRRGLADSGGTLSGVRQVMKPRKAD